VNIKFDFKLKNILGWLICFIPFILIYSRSLADIIVVISCLYFLFIKIKDKDASKLYEFNFILVRPDLMVAWRSNLLPDNPRTVLEKISGI